MWAHATEQGDAGSPAQAELRPTCAGAARVDAPKR